MPKSRGCVVALQKCTSRIFDIGKKWRWPAGAIASTPFTASSNAPGCQKLSFKPLISSGQALRTLEISSTTATTNLSPKGLKYSSRYLPFSPDRTGVQSSRAQAGFELHKWQDTHLHLIRALFLLVVWLAFLMEWESGEMYISRILLNPSNLLSCIIQD